MILENIETVSDKVYWHQFDEFYFENITLQPNYILEIGLAKGNSIRLLREKYPSATIVGFDIMKQQNSWPIDDNIHYYQIDQGKADGFHALMSKIGIKYDLIIEDGSHDPLHQKISLMECLNYINDGGIYILEDLHTSHIKHNLYIQRGLKNFPERGGLLNYKKPKTFYSYFGPLHCLLLLDFHLKKNLTFVDTKSIDFSKSLFSLEDIELLLERVKSIDFFKRLRLPYYCYSCHTSDFNFSTLKCSCGADLYSDSDSMTSLLKF